ncbi:FAD-dependent oxidoreductase [Corynebacterium cystitidis]|uniref:NADPH-dependent 2,4-dienoyl-CoA reductase, sulfur reductase n=1 Tax=Corynebacterium cystitidis DSM 20524 TaxID=1121357 RepID=A0A1H9VGU2_9CORY|nr:FAD-dependent oxidoreductase [Corynebacterium cystitidis]WJY81382.1 Coenzyme A disulfide reductase [Corynebacterium cystitidis DSM 20524]SES20694.1 NADPH-dependent 2,4-dienoyl-CoA reductase, sulfur reductase [Corynebacterium cystitidis DSM 20524]SNV87946.1 pyridine nucleotide-disulfide oxidoreductase [Corynebacterium cystitidis]
MTTTVIVGGVAGGMSTATRLRRNDEDMEIIVLEASNNVSFANCGLPYYAGGIIKDRDKLLLQTPQALKDRFNLDVRVNTTATSIDRRNQTVTITTPNGETESLHYDYLVLSPGATPIELPIEGIERALTLRTVEDVDAIVDKLDGAKTVAIIGGGFIGLELAENFTHRGITTTVIERAPEIMAPLDTEMSRIVRTHLEANGVRVLTDADTTLIDETSVRLADGTVIPADLVISSVGVKPASDLAREAGLEVGARGGIAVDEQQRTNDPKIFAVGDAAEKRDHNFGEATLVPLAQTANRHGRLVADIITGRNTQRTATLGTSIVGLFGLAAASVGWNERRAKAAGKNLRIIHLHPADHAGYYPGATQIHLKLVVDADTDLILGAQAVGENGVDKRIDVLATAMRAGLTATDLADLELAYAPQFGSAKDPINMAGFINDNMVNGEQTIQFYELNDELAGGAVLIDVREESEFAAGHIPGAVNIPLNQLRNNVAELVASDFADKRVIVHCQVGLRGHTATSLLRNHDVEVANLDGGYLTWSLAQ